MCTAVRVFTTLEYMTQRTQQSAMDGANPNLQNPLYRARGPPHSSHACSVQRTCTILLHLLCGTRTFSSSLLRYLPQRADGSASDGRLLTTASLRTVHWCKTDFTPPWKLPHASCNDDIG